MARKKKIFMLKPLAVLLGVMGWVGYASANTAANPVNRPYDGPFAQVPLHIIQTTRSSGVGVKPNVVLQIDNSFSMYASPDEYQDLNKYLPRGELHRSRLEITKRALYKLLGNPAYRDKVNWQMITLWDKPVESYSLEFGVEIAPQWHVRRRTDWWVDYAEAFLRGEKPFGRPPEELERMLEKLQATGYTPTTERYFDSIYLLQKALERDDTYRCQKSSVIIFSDGQPSSSGFHDIQKRVAANTAPMLKAKPAGSQTEGFYLDAVNQHYMRARHDAKNEADKGTDEPLIKLAWKEPFIYQHPEMQNNPASFAAKFVNPYPPPSTSAYSFLEENFHKLFRYDANSGYSIIPFQSASTIHYWTQRTEALRFLAETVEMNDLRKVGQRANPTQSGGRLLKDTDPAGKSYDDPMFPKQNIETYTIAFGINEFNQPNGFKYLRGGATAKGQEGKVYDARSEKQLDEAFASIFNDLVAKSLFEPPASFSGISPTVSSDEETRKVPNMAATTHLSMKTGSSEIYFYEVNNKQQGGTEVLKNRYTTPSFNNRRVLISDGQRPVSWLEQFAGNNAFFGIPDNGRNSNEWRNSMIPWLARSAADESLNVGSNALQYRNRKNIYEGQVQRNTRDMGDVVYAPILAYGPNEYGRQKYLLTAANDGMVYLFRSSESQQHPYDLKLNYIPAGMERESVDDTMGKHFKDIVHPEYVQNNQDAPHQFMVNGGFVVRTMDTEGAQQIFMAGNMGQGGRGMYALNVGGDSRANPGEKVGIDAPQEQWPRSVPLMETPKGEANKEMGYTINAPQIGRLALNRSVNKEAGKNAEMSTDLFDLRYAIFVGSGVSNPFKRGDGTPSGDKTESALYVYSPFNDLNVGLARPQGEQSNAPAHRLQQGELIKKIAIPPQMGKGGLAQPTLVDINFDGAIDIVYAGDYSGGMYRFDLRGGRNDWTVHKIFQTVNGQPITSAPAVFRNEQNKYIVMFGTGSDLYQKDLDDQSVQSMYGVYEDLTNFNPPTKYQSDLVAQTLTQRRVAVKGKNYDVRDVSNNGADDANIKGWYFDFPAGERVVVKPNVLLKSVLFSTRTYRVNRQAAGSSSSNDLCLKSTSSETTSGESWVMQVKVDNGGNIPNGKDASEEYAYADFLGQYERDSETKKYTRPDERHSGFRSDGGIVNMALLFGVNKDPNGIGGSNSSYTRDGDAGNSGVDSSPSIVGQKEVQLCFVDNNNKLLYNNTGDSKGLSDNFVDIFGILCPSERKGIVRRLSWRELF